MAQKILNNIYLWKIYLSCIHNRVYIFLYEKNLLKKKKKRIISDGSFSFFLYFFIYFLFFLFIYSLFFTRITISTFEFFNAARFLFFFSEIGNSDVILVIYIYNALLGLVFLSFIKLFSLYIHWLFFSIEEETWYFDCQCCTFDLKRDPTFPFVSHLSISLRDEQKRIREEYPNRGYVI